MSDDTREPRPVVSCLTSDWMDQVRLSLREGREVELVDFRYIRHGVFCEMAAAANQMPFTADIKKGRGQFSKR